MVVFCFFFCSFVIWTCTWSEPASCLFARQTIDSCAQHKVHVTMCIFLSFQYPFSWLWLFFVCSTHLELFFCCISFIDARKKVSPGDLFRFSFSVYFSVLNLNLNNYSKNAVFHLFSTAFNFQRILIAFLLEKNPQFIHSFRWEIGNIFKIKSFWFHLIRCTNSRIGCRFPFFKQHTWKIEHVWSEIEM